MDKRYQVFISSTFKDLQDERQEVMQALLELDCIPSGMELFPAANSTQWEIIKKVINDCDYYILILAGRYGSLAEDGFSYTEKEYNYAVEIGKPVLSFIHREPGRIIADKTETTEIGKEKLKKFREKVEKLLCKQWENPSELGSVVSRSMIQLIKTAPGIGWVRGDQVSDAEATNEILSLRKYIEEIEAKLKASRIETQEKIERLSRGEERVEIKYTFSARDENYHTSTWTATFTPSWDEIIAKVFPVCIDEATEGVITRQFNEFIENEQIEKLQKNKKLKDQVISSFKIEKESFHTVIIQLRALQIIKKSSKGKSVKDTATYWSLTDEGDQQLVMLRALKSRDIENKSEVEET